MNIPTVPTHKHNVSQFCTHRTLITCISTAPLFTLPSDSSSHLSENNMQTLCQTSHRFPTPYLTCWLKCNFRRIATRSQNCMLRHFGTLSACLILATHASYIQLQGYTPPLSPPFVFKKAKYSLSINNYFLLTLSDFRFTHFATSSNAHARATQHTHERCGLAYCAIYYAITYLLHGAESFLRS